MSGRPDEVGGLYEQLRLELRARRYSPRTERAYVGWVARYVAFHDRRHPVTLGAPDLKKFLDALIERRLAASSHQQALCALHFFYAKVLKVDPPWVRSMARPVQSQRLPLVLSRDEVRAVIGRMSGAPALMAGLLYGSGLRLLECARLRVKDVDFSAGHLVIRNGKGNRDRVTLLPSSLRGPLYAHLEQVRRTHQADLKAGAGYVELPGALADKYPFAEREWPWQWVFPATRHYRAPNGKLRRHHLHETVLQRAFRAACQAAHHSKPATCHTLRHSFATPPRSRLRHPHHPRALGPPRRGHHHDLHPRPQPRALRSPQPPGLTPCSHYQAQQRPALAAIITIPHSTTSGFSGRSPVSAADQACTLPQSKCKLGGPMEETAHELPAALLAKATPTGREHAWLKRDVLETFQIAREAGLACLGGQVQFVFPDGTCELYWLNYDPAHRAEGEQHDDYVARSNDEALSSLKRLISSTDFEHEGRRAFAFLREKELAGAQLNEHLRFVCYFVRPALSDAD